MKPKDGNKLIILALGYELVNNHYKSTDHQLEDPEYNLHNEFQGMDEVGAFHESMDWLIYATNKICSGLGDPVEEPTIVVNWEVSSKVVRIHTRGYRSTHFKFDAFDKDKNKTEALYRCLIRFIIFKNENK